MSTADLSPREEIWIYAGARIGQGNKLVECWIDADGKSLLFKAGRAAVVGGIYRARALRAGERISLVGRPAFERDGDLAHPLRPEWVVLDVEARSRLAALRAEKRALETGGLGRLTLSDLRRQAQRLPGPQRAGLLTAAIAFLMKP